MRVTFVPASPIREPRLWRRPGQVLGFVLRPGSIEIGARPKELTKFQYIAGEMILPKRHEEKWIGLMNAPHLMLDFSDSALMAASGRTDEEAELPYYRKFADSRLSALATAVHAEMVAGFPNGRLFLDSVEQAMAIALVNGYAIRHRPLQIYKGGLGPGRLRRIKEFIDTKMEDDLSLDEMAQSVGLSTAYFARMFHKSTGETPHQYVLRQRIERAKEMLRAPGARVLDVAVASGFKTQQHFAQVFRDVCGVSPREYRRGFLGSATCASEVCSEDIPRPEIGDSQPQFFAS